MNEPVIVDKRGNALWIRFNRPEDDNRIDRAAIEILTAALHEVADDPDVHVAVLTGSEQFFCSGGRVDPTSTDAEKAKYSLAITGMHETLAHVRPPVIAAVSGHCRAGGMAILAAADVAIAADDVEFGFPEINHGGFPVMAMASAMPLIPPKVAFDLFYSGRSMSAAEAYELRLVSALVPREQFNTAVDGYVEMILSRAPETMALGRRAFYGMEPMSPSSRLVYGREILTAVLKK